ncbi:MAG: glycosyltransferase N-terminal domain-containing protein [Myxococcota bacterium]|nr:glycosyltransferase N-terminal domain-containing protein [Myxococcota bacterium]
MSILRRGLVLIAGLLLAPVVALVWLARPALRDGWRERLGGGDAVKPGRVWVHGASLGEAHVATSLLLRLEAEEVPGFASAVTRAGRDVLAKRLPDVPHAYLPIDHPWLVARALDRVVPRALVLVETELWPCLIVAAFTRGIPVFAVSARLSDASFPRYRVFRFALAALLSRFAGIAARSQADADRFVALGASPERVAVFGDLKLDPVAGVEQVAADLVRALEGRRVVIAGSTHEGEEAAMLDAVEACERRGESVVLVIAPRHLDRVAGIERALAARGRRVVRRTWLDPASLSEGDVLLLDTTGELGALYATATVAFVGGTLVAIGGHNLLEPLFQEAPVLFGPHTENVRDGAALALECGGGRQVANDEELASELVSLLRDPKDARARGVAGREALEARRGNVGRVAAWLRAQLGDDAP